MDDEALEQLPPLPDDDDLVPSSVVKRENGGICDMTLYRWSHPGRSKTSQEQPPPEESAKIPFPPPEQGRAARRYSPQSVTAPAYAAANVGEPHGPRNSVC